jgi:hypothetical protein
MSAGLEMLIMMPWKIAFFKMPQNFVGHADGVVKHIQAGFTGTAAATEGDDHDVGVFKFFVTAGADVGIPAADGTADTIVQVQGLAGGFFF